MKPTATEIKERAKWIAASTVYSIQAVENALRYGLNNGFTMEQTELLIRAGTTVDAAIRLRDDPWISLPGGVGGTDEDHDHE